MLRGIKTLHLRVQRACENARHIVRVLQHNDLVANVYYPGLKDHPRHEVAKRQMKDFGAMISFDLREDTLEAAIQVMKNTHYFTLAESLGGVESLIGHPASMTHASVPLKQRLSVGLTDSLIRLSVGVEDAEDDISGYETGIKAIFTGITNTERYLLTYEGARHNVAPNPPPPKHWRPVCTSMSTSATPTPSGIPAG